MFKKFLIGAAIAGFMAAPSFAKTPPEVLASYKAYLAAQKAGDSKAAIKHAKAAWEQAETFLGDSKTTGDLAYNYAGSLPPNEIESAIKAFARAVELAPETTQAEAENKLERYVAAAQLIITTENFKRARSYLSDAQDLIKKHSLKGSTFDGEITALSGLLSYASGRDRIAAKKYNDALAIFEGDGHQYQSVFPYTTRIYKGNLLRWEDPIEAALEYQVVMQNLEGVVTKDHPIVETAFSRWLNMMSVINSKGILKEAEEAGVCKCWPYDEMRADAPVPIKRVPPFMPKSAKQSGHVIIKFDVDEKGDVTNPEAVSFTQKRFVKPALKSVKAWKYDPMMVDDNPQARKGVVTKISFRIVGRNGKIIPEPGEDR